MTQQEILAIQKLQTMEEFYVAYGVMTNMPYVTCDDETFNDQIWVFTNVDAVKQFADEKLKENMVLRAIKVKREEGPVFYVEMHSIGINEVVFVDEDATYKIELEKIVKIPDFSKLPEEQRPLLNQALQLSTIYFMQKAKQPQGTIDRAELEPLAEELYAQLAKARLLMPIMVTKNEDGVEEVHLPFIEDKEGNKFQPIFSDQTQYMKHIRNHKAPENTRVVIVTMKELQKHLMSNVRGYMLNPESYCNVLGKEQLEFICTHFQN